MDKLLKLIGFIGVGLTNADKMKFEYDVPMQYLQCFGQHITEGHQGKLNPIHHKQFSFLRHFCCNDRFK